MVLHESIQHGIGHSLVTYRLVPLLNRQLAGNNGGPLAGPVVNDLQQVGPGLTVQGGHAPVVEQQDVRIFEHVQPARKGAVGVANAQLLTQARNPQVQRTVATPAGMLGQRARQLGLARAGGPGDQHGVPGIDPLPQGQTHHRAAFNAPSTAAVQIFYGRLRVFEFGGFEQSRAAPVLPAMHLPVDQQGQPFLKARGADAALLELLLQRLGHGFQAQTAQLIQGSVHHHFGIFCKGVYWY